jgi:hypothetical protein
MKILFALLILSGCATPVQKPVEAPKTVEKILAPKPVEKVTVLPMKVWKTPKYHSEAPLTPKYREAISLIEKWANTDEFINYVAKKRTYFSHTDKTISEVLSIWRSQLDKGETIEITYYTTWWKGRAIGGWNGDKIYENIKWAEELTAIERAGHLLHETSHKYGWVHQGNYTNQFDNVNSFPYAIGYEFEDFLHMKQTQVAGK